MIDLKNLIKKYPNCLETSDKLRSYLKDLYPDEKARISIIVAIFSCDIYEQIKTSPEVDSLTISNFVERLENDYGYSQKISKECINLWLDVYQKQKISQKSDKKSSPRKTASENNYAPAKKATDKNTSTVAPKKSDNMADFVIDGTTLKKYKANDSVVTIPSCVTIIGERAFKHCVSLTKVIIPNSVISIGKQAFKVCKILTKITIPNNVTSIGEGAFSGCKKLKEIIIPDGVTSIGEEVFSGCDNLTKIIMSNSLTSVGNRAFEFCKSLTSITMPNSVTSIGSSAFSGCKKLNEITMSNSLTSIGSRTFDGCNSLSEITIPNNVTSIGAWTFSGCDSLFEVTIPNSVTSIGEGAFDGCENLSKITVSLGNKYYCDDNGILLSKNKQQIIKYPAGKQDYKYIISNGVTSIGKWAFSGCDGLSEITIPNGVTSISKWAFVGCDNLTILIDNNPYVEKYAQNNHLKYTTSKMRAEKQKADYRSRGVCQYCGADFKGFSSKKCSNCGKKKDY